MEFPLFRSQQALFELLRFEVAPACARLVLRGASGAGKSYLLQTLAEYCSDHGKVVIIACGEQGVARPFQPFLRATGPASTKLSSKRFAAQGAEAVARSVPIVGSLVGFVTQAITNDRTRTRRERLRYLRPDEFEALLHIESIIHKSNLLIIADNLQYWDADSLSLLLDLLRRESLVEDFPFVDRMACILGITDGREPANTEAFRAIMEGCEWREHVLVAIDRDEIRTAIATFGGLANIPDRELAALNAITGGHLGLLRVLAFNLAHSRTEAQGDIWRSIRESSPGSLEKIIDARIGAMGDIAGEVRAVLGAAAVIGESFTQAELVCLTKLEDRVLWEVLLILA